MRRSLLVGGTGLLRFLSAQKVNNAGWAMGAIEFRVAAGQAFFTQEIAVFEANIGRCPVGVVSACSHGGASVVLLLAVHHWSSQSVVHHC